MAGGDAQGALGTAGATGRAGFAVVARAPHRAPTLCPQTPPPAGRGPSGHTPRARNSDPARFQNRLHPWTSLGTAGWTLAGRGWKCSPRERKCCVFQKRDCNSASSEFPRCHVTLFRPALSFLSGRCGRASQHKVFRNTTSFLDWPLFNTLLAATNTEFPLVTSDTVSRPLPEHSTTQTSHNNPHVCRPHRNGTPSLLSERHNAARNTRTCGIMTRHAPPVMTRK